MPATPTATEVRAAHKDAGNEVKISRDGRVQFRAEGDTAWLEGRWVEEYQRDDAGNVII